MQVAAERLLMVVRAIAREAVAHELQRRERQVDLVGVVLVDQSDPSATRAHHWGERVEGWRGGG